MSVFEKLQKHAPLLRHQLGERIKLGSRDYRVRGYHTNGLAWEASEPFMLPVLERILKRPGAFIDVGANVGQTLFKVLSIDPDRQYVGFEPQSDCCFYVGQFLRDNGLSSAAIVPVALSDRHGLFPLYLDRPNDDMASLLPSHTQRAERSSVAWVQARVGDEAFAELGITQIAAVKIDVEGFELEVLKGLSNTLKSLPPVLFEVLTNYAWGKLIEEPKRSENSRRAGEIFSLLTGAGYSISRIDAAGNEHPIDRFDLDTPPPPRFGEGRDYIAQ